MWTLNGIRIFVTDFGNDYKQIIAKLNPLNGGTVYHRFGYDYVTSKLTCYFVGDTDNLAIRNLTRTGNSYQLISDQGSYGNFFVNSISIQRLNSICQTLRPDLDEEAPVYRAEMELYLDE